MTKYKILRALQINGSFTDADSYKILHNNLNLMDAIKKTQEITGVEDVHLDIVIKSKEDSFGNATKIIIKEDKTVATLFNSLTSQEQYLIFHYAQGWMQKECSIVPELSKIIENFERNEE